MFGLETMAITKIRRRTGVTDIMNRRGQLVDKLQDKAKKFNILETTWEYNKLVETEKTEK